MVAIGWHRVGNLTDVHGREAIADFIKRQFPEYTKTQAIVATGQVYRFRDELVEGQFVLTYDPALREYHLGQVASDYIYVPQNNEHCQHTRRVSWLRVVKRDNLSATTKNSLGAIATIFCVSQEAAREILDGTATNRTVSVVATETAEPETDLELRKDTEQRALEFLQDRLSQLAWDEMQELVAGLLRAMGYKTKVAPAGADRGRDIVASPDGFGFQAPRIFVEVKHRNGRMGAPAIRTFTGGLRPNDNGLYVSTGGFTQEARYEAERSNHPVTLMDADDLVSAIVEYYDRMDLETRTLLPLRKIYWPA